MKLTNLIDKRVKEHLNESLVNYSTWKRKNVTLRGIKELGKPNEVYGSFGKGLYTVPLSNKAMAKQYGTVYFVVGAIPKNAKVVDSLNSAEILRQNLIQKFCEKNGVKYSVTYFEEHTSMDEQMQNLGYDGLIIKGREMVNYNPSGDVRYFETENQLMMYYEFISR